jgi:Aspartyl protease
MVTLLLNKPHLMKELNYYAPSLARQIQQSVAGAASAEDGNDGNPHAATHNPHPHPHHHFSKAVQIYRDYMVTKSIKSAVQTTTTYHEQYNMTQRYTQNPHDVEAKSFLDRQTKLQLIQEQYEHVLDEYPESMIGHVLMLYIPLKINGYSITAFCDSGAQQTIMSKTMAISCQLYDLIDTRMAGIAVGVGTGVILGRIHMVQIELTSPINQQSYYFPCSITVMDDPKPIQQDDNNDILMKGDYEDEDENEDKPSTAATATSGKEMPFLLGLDMMKRHLCCIDLQMGCIRFTQIQLSTTTSNSSNNSTTSTTASAGTTTENGPPIFLEIPFLHEKDLSPKQGGTKKEDNDNK